MNYLSLAAIGTVIASSWSYIKGFLNRFRSIFIVQIKLDGEAGSALMYLLWNEFKRSSIGDRRFTGTIKFVNPLKKMQRIGLEKLPKDSVLFWRNRIPISVNVQCDQYDNYTEGRINISFIRFTLDIDKLLIEALDKYNKFYSITEEKKVRNRFQIVKMMGQEPMMSANSGKTESEAHISVKAEEDIEKFRILKWNLSDLTMEIPNNPFNGYFFDKEVLELINEVEFWLKSEKYFEKISVPFRRGWTLHSVAGCGKTSLIRAIGQKFDLPIITIDLSTMTNHDLTRNWKKALSFAPCIILFEDFDSQFHGRKNIANEKGVTFDALLNCIGGIETTNGIFTIVTTNDLSKLDSALIRPGRCGDRIIELKPISTEQKLNMAKYILQEYPEEINKIIKNSKNDTPAKFQQKCADIALKRHWQKLKN